MNILGVDIGGTFTDIVVIGINQAQRVGSDDWWRADLRPAAEAAVPVKKP